MERVNRKAAGPASRQSLELRLTTFSRARPAVTRCCIGRTMTGFTLVELVLTMTILGIMVIVSGILMGRGVDAYRLVSERTDVVQQGRVALMRIEKELETLRDVVTIQPTRLQFRDTDLALQEFRLNGTTLLRNDEILAEHVSALNFLYYRENGNETQSPPQVRRIHVELTVQGDGTSGSLALRTDIFPRNFIYENFQ